ncbi:metallophosphoesterase family protein [Oceanomicrobium pacificus]|uniref:Metallophosphoesterase n=1 Tax=Oceanomicrobium pacificus TaxID=2692916 RepID=A0A6B0TY90_9RHOB|nr:metallophosphoesterase [Oceanomicrobium pacificus]MXU66252.1 metallophosphoesterase [Oceanomicrobium pacificus]
MQFRNLGRIDGPLCLFGGPYSNLQALAALTGAARAAGVADGAMICTGDLVAYGADPVAVAERVRDAGWAVAAGNCERQLANGAADCGCGFEEGSQCDLLSKGWYAHASARIGDDLRFWMGDLPDGLVFDHAGRRFAVIHGGADDISRFIWPDAPEPDLLHQFALVEAVTGPVDAIIAGHCGLPFKRQLGQRSWINPGVIGMPPHDGDPRTAFAIVQNGRVQMHRLAYDCEGAARAMEAAGLTQGYQTALRSGWWPSEDILPPAFRRAPAGQSRASG